MSKDAVLAGIKRNQESMSNIDYNLEEAYELELAFYSAKAYIAGCNDSGVLTYKEWQHEWEYLNTLYKNLKTGDAE